MLVRLEPRELKLAARPRRERAAPGRSAARHRSRPGQAAAGGRADRVGPPGDGQSRRCARSAFERAQQLNGRGLLTQADRDTAETRAQGDRGELPGRARQRAQPEGEPAGPPRVLRARAEEAGRRRHQGAGRRLGVRTARAARRIHPREHAGRDHRPDEPAEAEDGDSGKARERDPAGPGASSSTSRRSSNRTFNGKIAYVSPAVDQATRTFPVEALVDNTDRVLKPGFFAKGVVLTRVDENVLAVPDDAVSTLAGVSTVYVIENGKARQQQVTLGARQDKLVEVVDGPEGRRDAGDEQPEPARDRRDGAHRRRGEANAPSAAGRRRAPRRARRSSRSAAMRIAEVSVKRPVFAIMMTAALIVLGAVSYESLGLDLMPKTDAPVVIGAGQPARAPAPRRSRRRSPSASRRRSTPSAASTSCAPPPTRATRASPSPSPSSATSSRRRRTSATSSRTIVNQFPRDTRPLQITKMDPDAQPIFGFARLRSARAEGDHRDRRQARQAGARDGQGRRLGRLQRRAQARDPAAAQRRPPERLRPDGRSGAQRGRAAERRDSRRQFIAGPGRSRAPHDGPHQERRRFQPHRHRVPRRRLGRSRSPTSAACRTRVQEVRSANRLNGDAGRSACRSASSRAPTPSKWSTACRRS